MEAINRYEKIINKEAAKTMFRIPSRYKHKRKKVTQLEINRTHIIQLIDQGSELYAVSLDAFPKKMHTTYLVKFMINNFRGEQASLSIYTDSDDYDKKSYTIKG